ncbi:hypothetical protein HK098_000632, partial [Nowakowskiella sp. JEL0407]
MAITKSYIAFDNFLTSAYIKQVITETDELSLLIPPTVPLSSKKALPRTNYFDIGRNFNSTESVIKIPTFSCAHKEKVYLMFSMLAGI